MKITKIKGIISSILVTSMFVSNIAYAENVIDTETVVNEIGAAISYGVDKAKNTFAEGFSFSDNNTTEGDETEEEFQDPGKELSKNDMKALYQMGYSVLDISNAVKLSKKSDKTPYQILQMKGLREYSPINEAALMSQNEDDTENNSIEATETAWSEVVKDLGIDDDIQENSEMPYEENLDEVKKTFDDLNLTDILLNEGISESEIQEALSTGTVESVDITDNLADGEENSEAVAENSEEPLVISGYGYDGFLGEASLLSNNPSDMNSALYNGYIYPSMKYKSEKVQGYTLSEGFNINPLTGNSMFVANDITLKGINGLDLNLNRVYSSARSNMLEAQAYNQDDSYEIQTKQMYQVMMNADITIEYRESESSGNSAYSTKVLRDRSISISPQKSINNIDTYVAVDASEVINQVREGKYHNLFSSRTEADNARKKALDEKCDRKITFASGRIKSISLNVNIDATGSIKTHMVSIPNTEYYTRAVNVDDNKSFSNIGVGWEFDFPYIEIKEQTVSITSSGTTEQIYEYLHYGTKGTWLYDPDNENYSNLDGYALKDMKLTDINSRFDGRTARYLLEEKDGRKTYFGEKGQLLGIEDRFGNKIRFYYENNSILTKIIDTVGREIEFGYGRSESINVYSNYYGKEIPSERQFIDITIKNPVKPNENRTITYVKEKVIDVLLSTADENEIDISDRLNKYELVTVIDSENIETKYDYQSNYQKVSLTDKSIDQYAVEIPYSILKTCTFASGAYYRAELSGSGYENIGTDGLKAIKKVYKVSNFIPFEKIRSNGKKTTSYKDVGGKQYEYDLGVSWTGYPYYRSIQEAPEGFLCETVERNYKAEIEDDVNKTFVYLYKDDDFVKQEETIETSTLTKSDSGLDVLTPYYLQTNQYEYNDYNLCTKITSKNFEDPAERKKFVTTVQTMSYDDYGNTLSVEKDGDSNRKTTYAYDSTYHLPTNVTYKKDVGTTVKINYTLTNDKKAVDTATTTENNSTKRKVSYSYDSHGNVVTEKRYGVNNNFNSYVGIAYEYKNADTPISDAYVTKISVSGIKNADGGNAAGTNGSASGTVEKKYSYDSWGNVISETDCNGNIFSYEYDKINRLKKQYNPDNSYKSYDYCIQFNQKEVLINNYVDITDENGTTNRQSYDPLGNIIAEKNLTDNIDIKSYDYYYLGGNGSNIVTEHRDENNATKTVISYDGLKRPTTKTVYNNQDILREEAYLYDILADDGLSKETVITKGESTAGDVKTISYADKYENTVKEEVVYNDNGTEKSAITEYTYDLLGNRLTVREPRANEEGWAANEYTAEYEYDVVGNITKETDISGKSIVNTYDGLGNLISVKDKNGNTSTTTYDALGRILKEQIPFQKNGTSTVYAENKYYYDANGNTIKSQTANNAAGAGTSYTTTEYAYNWQNQPTKVCGFNGSDVENCVQYYYDNVGNVLRMYTGDVDSLVINGLDSVSGASDYAVTKYAYDSMNRCISQTDALGQTVSNTYDINGNLTQMTDRNGNVLSYSYDGLNQLLQKSSSKTDADTYAYTYNKKGNRTSMTGGGVDTTSIYDNLGRLTKENLTDGTVKEYTYDINGNRKSFKLTKDNAVQYTLSYDYDKQNQLTKVYEDGNVKAEYSYNPDGTLKKSSYGSRTTDYSYNLAQLLTEVNNANGSTQISKYSYTYYVDGNQKSKTESVAGTNKDTTNYTYDGLNRLIKEQAHDKAYSYQYDSYGNRSQLSVTGDETYTTSYTYDKNNRMRNQTKTAGSAKEITDFWYDPNGNQISSMTVSSGGTGTPGVGIEPVGGSSNSVNEYDSWNQLTKTMQNGKTASYSYNGDGLRMSKTVDGTTTSHIWDGINIAGDVTNGTVTKYIRGLQLISSKAGSSESFYNCNGHGDVVQLTNSSGNIAKQYNYDAFGVELNKIDSDTNPLRYCGEYYDDESSNIYLRARYYNSVTGKFITEDPIKDGMNWYNYCACNPIGFIDPLGTEYIVVSGAEHNTLIEHRYKYNFIEPAITKLRELRDLNDGETITWLICSMGYSKSDKENFTKTAQEYGVELRFFSTNDSLIRYINTKGEVGSTEKRDSDKIKKFVVFSHGLQGSIEFGYHQDNQSDVSFDYKQIARLRMQAFDNPNSCFYSCNTGTDDNDGASFAQSWVNKTGGKTWAIYEKSDYAYINNLDNWKSIIKPERKNTGYRPGGSDYYPMPSAERNAYWRTFENNVRIY